MQEQLCQKQEFLFADTYFSLFNNKSCNIRVIMLIISMLTAKTFLFHVFSVVFVFSNMKIAMLE